MKLLAVNPEVIQEAALVALVELPEVVASAAQEVAASVEELPGVVALGQAEADQEAVALAVLLQAKLLVVNPEVIQEAALVALVELPEVAASVVPAMLMVVVPAEVVQEVVVLAVQVVMLALAKEATLEVELPEVVVSVEKGVVISPSLLLISQRILLSGVLLLLIAQKADQRVLLAK